MLSLLVTIDEQVLEVEVPHTAGVRLIELQHPTHVEPVIIKVEP